MEKEEEEEKEKRHIINITSMKIMMMGNHEVVLLLGVPVRGARFVHYHHLGAQESLPGALGVTRTSR